MKKSFWFPGKSLLPWHRCDGTGCPLSLPWHGPSASPSPPSLCQHQCDHWRKTFLLLKEKLLCCAPTFQAASGVCLTSCCCKLHILLTPCKICFMLLFSPILPLNLFSFPI